MGYCVCLFAERRRHKRRTAMEGYSPEDRELLREMRRVRRRLKEKRLLWGLIGWAFLSAAVGLILQSWLFTLTVAHGPGMGDTLPSGSVALVQRIREGHSPARGNVILFEYGDSWAIKRVAAVGGDEVDQDENGQLTVNGTAIAGCSAMWTEELPEMPFIVSEGEYFVLGDRYDLSVDSRSPAFGTVKEGDVVGTAKYIIWPAYRIGEIK